MATISVRRSAPFTTPFAASIVALVVALLIALTPQNPAFAEETSNDLQAGTIALETPSATSGTLEPLGDELDSELSTQSSAQYPTVPYTVTATRHQTDCRAMLAKVNNLRASEGASVLMWDEELEKCAIQRAAECAVMFSHTRPNGADCFSINDKVTGENIAYNAGYANSATVAFDGWVASPGHHANMVNSTFKSIGIGCVSTVSNGRTLYFYVQVFSYQNGSGMKGSAANNSSDFNIQVPAMGVASMSVKPVLYLGVGSVERLPDVKLTYQSLEYNGDRIILRGTQTHRCEYFLWDLKDTSIAAFSSDKPLIAGKKKGKTTGMASLSGYVKSATFTVEVTSWSRLWGNDAYGTMSSIVGSAFDSGSCDTVVLATFDGYWDALTASGYAGFHNCPVLMTGTDSLNAITKSEIARLGASRVVIAGGTAAVSTNVENQVRAIKGVKTVERAKGADAAGTARAMYELAKKNGNAWGDTAFVATAGGYWDALAASPLSYQFHYPIFLANVKAEGNSAKLDAETIKTIKNGGFKTIVICGGNAAVSRQVEKQLSGIGLPTSSVVRKSGATAAETSAALASCGVSKGMSSKGIAVATIDGYWDALSGAAFCGVQNTPLVLVNDGNRGAVNSFIKPNASKLQIGVVFGGTAAVSDSVYRSLIALF